MYTLPHLQCVHMYVHFLFICHAAVLPETHEPVHCKEPIPKIRNKYSQERK
jgi:hypothetical protein